MTVMLEDRTISISAHHTIAALFWIAGAVLVVSFVITQRPGLGALGIFLGLIAGTVNIRGFLCEHARIESQHEVEAFELGTKAGAQVRQI
jgi:hypothetical protein